MANNPVLQSIKYFFAGAVGPNVSRELKCPEYALQLGNIREAPSDIPQVPNFAIFVHAFSFIPSNLFNFWIK